MSAEQLKFIMDASIMLFQGLCRLYILFFILILALVTCVKAFSIQENDQFKNYKLSNLSLSKNLKT